MAEVHIAHGFLEDLDEVRADKLLQRILDVVDSLEFAPEMGSRNVPDTIRAWYGEVVRKIAVNPFDIVTCYDDAADVVEVVGLIHQKRAG